MNSNSIFRVAVAFAAGLFVIAFTYFTLIRPFWQDSQGGPLVMHTYPVSADYADEVRSALQGALQVEEDGKPIGKVSLAPNGQLIVTAPKSVQSGIQALLDDIAAHSPGSTPTIRLEAWLVKASALGQERGANLKELDTALAAIAEAQGVQGFGLVEKLTMNVRSGQRGSITGVHAMLGATATVRRDQKNINSVAVMLSLQKLRDGLSVNTLVEVQSGEFLVLGQTAYPAEVRVGGPDESIYYILRATL